MNAQTPLSPPPAWPQAPPWPSSAGQSLAALFFALWAFTALAISSSRLMADEAGETEASNGSVTLESSKINQSSGMSQDSVTIESSKIGQGSEIGQDAVTIESSKINQGSEAPSIVINAGTPASAAPKAESGSEAPTPETPAIDFDGAIVTFPAMMAKCEILVPALSGSKLEPQALAELAKETVLKIDGLLSPAVENSDIRKINESTPNRLVKVDPLTMRAIILAWEWRERSDGYFEPTIGPVKKLYHFDGKMAGKLPNPQELSAAKDLTGPDAFILDQENSYVSRLKAGAMLDLGAIGKGFAADLAAEALSSQGVENALINIGGEMRIMGHKPQDGILKPWTVEISDPSRGPGRYLIEAHNQAVASSGNYESYFMHQGRRLSHIIDPKTGLPAEDIVAGATVIHPTSAADADAMATFACLLGPEKTGPWLKEKASLFPNGVTVLLMVKDALGEISTSYLTLSPGGRLTSGTP